MVAGRVIRKLDMDRKQLNQLGEAGRELKQSWAAHRSWRSSSLSSGNCHSAQLSWTECWNLDRLMRSVGDGHGPDAG